MPYQAFNKKTKRWVKYSKRGSSCRITDVKQKEPTKPFKGIPKRGQRRK